MKKRVVITIVILIFALIVFKALKLSGMRESMAEFKTEEITRGDLQKTVSSTGTINAVRTVEAGTQVSGIIDKLYVDFNDQVKKGQLLAVLDTVLLKTSLIDAKANVEKATAQLDQAEADLKRNEPLFKKGLISEAEFTPVQVKVKTQQATLKSAESALVRAKRNLEYAFIESPINGTVIQRSVEQGQTVAATLQAPVLFIIAEDLSKMEIHANVDESDIGQIKDGQKVQFEVQAYPDNIFSGEVKQIRLQPTTIQNVVNYTVIVDAVNDEYLLLPGMTATVDFIINEVEKALLIPNAALRFKPSDEMKNGKGAENNLSNNEKDGVSIWCLDQNEKPTQKIIHTGVSNGKKTEIVQSEYLEDGMKVITRFIESESKKEKNSNKSRGFEGGGPPF